MAYRRPESVLVVVYTRAGDVLALRRCRPFDFWQSVTGALEAGETPAETATRELFEETGIDAGEQLIATGTKRVFVIDPRWRDRYAPGVTENTEWEFRLELQDRCPIALDPREHSEYAWLSADRAIERFWSWTNKDAIRELVNACEYLQVAT
ncbi:MAG: dihydroneopterin triphosphate diphosphatase [Pseudomonadota bacterium]